ncbi:MAG: hypothetical protein ACOYXY_14655 [Thermodesulfobacteriota bacterium]
MFRKRLDPRRLVADIHAGLDDTEIMDKYHVSRGQLRAVLKKLITRGGSGRKEGSVFQKDQEAWNHRDVLR